MSDDYLDDENNFVQDEGEQVTRRLQEIASATERTIRDRKAAYLRVFSGGASAGDVLLVSKDLARFCRADVSAFRADAREHAALEGRREVWLRIRDHLDLELGELVNKYTTGELP